MWVRGGVGGWAVSQPHLPGALQSLSLTLEMESYFKRHMLSANLYVLMHMQSCCAAYLNFFFDVPIAVTVVNYA